MWIVEVSGITTGVEQNGKHFDTKMLFLVNKDRIVMHGYNSTSNIKVEGSTYLKFINNYLEPLFLQEVSKHQVQIMECDKAIISSMLKPSAPLRTRSVKSIRSSINQPLFTCKKCDFQTISSVQFKKHKHAEHSISFNTSGKSVLSIKQSTRNNSFSEALMCEEIPLGITFNEEVCEIVSEEIGEENKTKETTVKCDLLL